MCHLSSSIREQHCWLLDSAPVQPFGRLGVDIFVSGPILDLGQIVVNRVVNVR